MRAHTSRFSRLTGSLLAGAFFATLLAPWGPSLAAPSVDASIIPRIETAPEARNFFLGDPKSRDKLSALFCEKYDTPSGACPDQSNKPYLRVAIVRGGQQKGANPFPLVAVGTSSGQQDQKSYQLWVFQSQDNPRLVIGFYNSGRAADYTQMSVLPAGKTAMTKDVLAHIERPDPGWKVADVRVDGEMSRVLPAPGDDPKQDEKTSAWSVQKVDVGESGGLAKSPIEKAFGSIQGLLNSSIAYLINQYKDLVDSLLTNDYLKFLPYGAGGTAVAASSGAASATAPVIDVWHLTRDLANIFFLIVLLAIAFGNVLRLEYYAIRALLPRFIAAVVLVNLSLLIVQVILDAMGVLTAGILGDVVFGDILSGVVETSGAVVGLAGGGLFFGTFLLITIALAVLTVVVLLVARIVMLWFLVAVAPAAFLAAVLPATRELYTSWWSAFWRFALIAPAMALVLRLASAFSETPAPSETGGALLRTTLIVALLFLAGTIPVMLGGKLMAGIQKFMQKRGEGLRKGALSRSTGYQAMQQIRQQRENIAIKSGTDLSDAIGQLPIVGRYGTRGAAAGVVKFQASKREDGVGLLSIAENRRHALDMRLPEDERYAHAEKLVKAEIWGGDDLSAAIESGAIRHSLGASLVKEMAKAQINPFNLEHEDPRIRAGAERLAALRNGVLRDYLPPKFIDEPGGLSAVQKIVMRWSREDIQKQAANQLERLPVHVRRLITLDEYDLNDLDTRRYLNFVSAEGSAELTRLMRMRTQDPQTIPVELRPVIQDENRLIQYLVQWERANLDPHRRRFEHVNYVTQRSIVRAPRDTSDWLEQEQVRRDRGTAPDVVPEEEGEAG